jgi:NAD(P)-dependent dehydrogenase (short-subunit alcohol dehydrogenase family)
VFTADIVASTGNAAVEVHYLDLSSLDTVRQFANNIINTEPRLDVLINNAGVAGAKNKITGDNLQLGMQVNHFGPFLLTCLLLGKTLSAGELPLSVVFF